MDEYPLNPFLSQQEMNISEIDIFDLSDADMSSLITDEQLRKSLPWLKVKIQNTNTSTNTAGPEQLSSEYNQGQGIDNNKRRSDNRGDDNNNNNNNNAGNGNDNNNSDRFMSSDQQQQQQRYTNQDFNAFSYGVGANRPGDRDNRDTNNNNRQTDRQGGPFSSQGQFHSGNSGNVGYGYGSSSSNNHLNPPDSSYNHGNNSSYERPRRVNSESSSVPDVRVEKEMMAVSKGQLLQVST